MLSGIFRSQPTKTRMGKFPELQSVLKTIKKLHKKEKELNNSAVNNGPHSIDQKKHEVIANLLKDVDQIIADFNEAKTDDPQQEMTELVTAIHKLFVRVANTRRLDDNILMMLRDRKREIASNIVYGGTMTVTLVTGTTVFFNPLGLVSMVHIAPIASKKMAEITGLNDLSPESMRLINQLFKELSELDQRYIRKYYNNKEIHKEGDEQLEDFLCPITKSIMEDPVVSRLDGVSFERAAIEQWLSMKRTSPITRFRIPAGLSIQDMLTPNRNLKSAIERFLAKNPAAYDENSTEQKPTMTIIKK